MRVKEIQQAMIHVDTINRILTQLTSQDLNFKEEDKALALLWSFPTSWEDFCTTGINNSSKITLDETINMVLPEEL